MLATQGGGVWKIVTSHSIVGKPFAELIDHDEEDAQGITKAILRKRKSLGWNILTGAYSQMSTNGVQSSPCLFSVYPDYPEVVSDYPEVEFMIQFKKMSFLDTPHRDNNEIKRLVSSVSLRRIMCNIPKDKECHTETQDCLLIHVRCIIHICYVNEAQLWTFKSKTDCKVYKMKLCGEEKKGYSPLLWTFLKEKQISLLKSSN